MLEYAKEFYLSRQWKECRRAYIRTKGYICERCGALADVIHHKVYITPHNINLPDVTLNFDNLEALCHECHNKEHNQKPDTLSYKFNEYGEIEMKVIYNNKE